MQEYLPKEAYKAVTDAIEKGTPINREMADLIVNGMKSWANPERYPLHPLVPTSDRRYSRKAMTASSNSEKTEMSLNAFPESCLSNRNRMLLLAPTAVSATHSRHADTYGDASSPAFVVDTTLCIPTIFISYTGEALDYKTPLLKALAVGQSRNGCLPAFRQEHSTCIYELGLGTGIFPRRSGVL